MEAAIWGLIGTVVGALASIATTWLSGRHNLELQRHATSLERIERGRAFQRQNLLDIQDAFHDALRTVTRAHLEDVASFKRGGEWGRSYLSEEINEGVRVTGRKVLILTERVQDDALRSDLKASMEVANQVLRAKSKESAEAALDAATIRATETMEHIGRVLRALH